MRSLLHELDRTSTTTK